MSLSSQLLPFFFSLLVKVPLVLWDPVIQMYKARALHWNISAHFSVLHQIALAGSFYSLPCKWWKPLSVKQKELREHSKRYTCITLPVRYDVLALKEKCKRIFLDKGLCKYNICMLFHFAQIFIIQLKIVCFQELKSKKILE